MLRRLLCTTRAALWFALALGLAPTLARPAGAQDAFTPAQRAEIVAVVRSALRTDPTILRDAIVTLQQQDAPAQQVAARAAIDRSQGALTHADGDPSAGAADGDVTLVEFYDLRCPYCRKMLPVVAQLLHDDPRLRLVYKDIPILGAPSVLGARAVLAAQRQGGYLRLHDAVMTGPGQITEDSLHDAAGRAGLDWSRLRRDMDDPVIAHRIDANLELARSLGVNGTPAYVVGSRMMPGAVDLDDLKQAVAAARAGRG